MIFLLFANLVLKVFDVNSIYRVFFYWTPPKMLEYLNKSDWTPQKKLKIEDLH